MSEEEKKEFDELREALRHCAKNEDVSGLCESCGYRGRTGCISQLIFGAEKLIEYYEGALAEAEAETAAILADAELRRIIDAILRCTGEAEEDACLDCPQEDARDCSDVLIEGAGEIFRRLWGEKLGIPVPGEARE